MTRSATLFSLLSLGALAGCSDYDFAEDPVEAYAPVDRMGMPAVNTAIITSKDLYNESTPQDDVDQVFVPEIVSNLTALHEALDDDLIAAGLVPCEVQTCASQGAPLVIPDVLHLDLSAPAGFPNGRRLPDPVIDVTLAVVLLDLGADGQDASTLAGLPLNPPANDKPFRDVFPYVAEAH